MKLLRFMVLCFVLMVVFDGGSKAFSEQSDSNLSIGTDLRYRHELIDAEGKDMRSRHRIRARLNMTATLNDEVKLGFQLASGGDDPVSTNQTLSEGFSTKQVNIDQAFFEWKPESIAGFTVYGGKVKNPFYTPGKTELIWDGDLRPEGFALQYSNSSDTATLFVNTSYFWVEERKADNDAVLLGGQIGVDYKANASRFVVGLGYFDYQNTKKCSPFFDDADSNGNSVDGNGNYLYDFNDLEIFCKLTPHNLINNASFFVNYVTNIAKDVDDNQGWLLGISYGKCKKPGTFDFRYSFRHIEKDAVIGAFTDSDFIGGGTDGEGHEVNFNYQIASKTKIGASYFFNQKGTDDGKEYHRLQLDVNFKL